MRFMVSRNWALLIRLDGRDIQVLKSYGAAPYASALKKLEAEIRDRQKSINEKLGMSP